jgi:hypothetical protein
MIEERNAHMAVKGREQNSDIVERGVRGLENTGWTVVRTKGTKRRVQTG